MSKIDYYGSENNKSISYLEFGAIDIEQKNKLIWAYWQDQEAYDLYMFSRYARDLISFRKFSENRIYTIEALDNCIKNTAHDKILDYVFKYASLISVINSNEALIRCCESGSSLLGYIEEAIALDHVFHDGDNVEKIKGVKWIASDISQLMNDGAKAFHPNTEIYSSEAPTISELSKDIAKLDNMISLFYGLSVSYRYALRKSSDLVAMAKNCRLLTANRLSLSAGDTFTKIYGSGKSVYIISLPELKEHIKSNHLKAVYCTENMQFGKDGEGSLRASIAIAESDDYINSFINEYNHCVRMINGEDAEGIWKPLELLEIL